MNRFNMRFYLMAMVLMFGNIANAQKTYKTWDQFKCSGPGLKQVGVLAVKHSREISSSAWSVGCETLDRDYGDFSIYKDYVGELGVKHARIQSGWAKCEKEKGVYQFEWLDQIVNGLVEQSIEPWMCLCYGNPLYDCEVKLGSQIFTDEQTMSAWLKYVEVTVTRYKDVIKEWEIWNEPDGGQNRGKGHEAYANLLMKTAETIRKVQPDAIIIGMSTVRVNLKYIEEILDTLKENGKLDLLNYVCYHPYYHNPDEVYDEVQSLRGLVKSFSPDLKLFQGECGCPCILEYDHALKYYPWTEISQAKWLMRRMAGDRVRDIRTSIFTIIDLKYSNMLQSFGLIRANLLHEIIYKRPSYYGVQHMVSFFDDSVIPVGELTYKAKSYREMTVAGFKKNNKPVLLVWYNDRVPDDNLTWDIVDLTVNDTNFADPIYVEMVSGKAYEINGVDWKNHGSSVKFTNLPVWDSVIMIADRPEVDFVTE